MRLVHRGASSLNDGERAAIAPSIRGLIEGLHIQSRVGSAEDGASFVALSPNLGVVEVWRLAPGTLTLDAQRRLVLLRTVDSGSLLPIRQVIDGVEPCHVLAGGEGFQWNAAELWPSGPAALGAQLSRLFEGLAEAHDLGVVHGSLGREHLGKRRDGDLVLDLTGLRVRPACSDKAYAPGRFASLPSPADDVWALATLAAESPFAAALDLASLLAERPESRPSARDAAAHCAASAARCATPTKGSGTATTRGAGADVAPAAERSPEPAGDAGLTEEDDTLHGVPRRLGAYHLLESIGAGGMGRVFRARDEGGGPDVAVKVLMPHLAADPDLVARFRRETRVLARLQSPYVARYLASNEQEGFHYLVMELVVGVGADAMLRERSKLEVDPAVRIACDVARALAEVHSLGLVHRDIKPSNVLVIEGPDGMPTARLCDFGIARPERPDDSDQLTREGAPGTPTFMAPEQVEGAQIDARTDVYALGATLFALLAGRAPFVGPSHFVMIAHVTEPPPYLLDLEPTIPRAIADVVARCLAKVPGDRPQDGAALLDELSLAWRGPSTGDLTLPHRIGIEGEPRAYDFVWPLRTSPERLWPHVSNTDRVNRAAGLDEVEWTHNVASNAHGDDVHTEGRFRAVGMELRWKENPFEWVAPHRLGVVREYSSGPFLWLRSIVTMVRSPEGGTSLRHRIEIKPRSLFGQAVASVEIGLRLRRGLGRTYERIDAACGGAREASSSSRPADPFEACEPASGALRARVDGRALQALRVGADPHVIQVLSEEACSAPAPNLTRLRPRAWARSRGFPEGAVVTAFLLAASEKLLEMQWDLLCPVCRIASSLEASLAELRSHGHCEACNLDYELDLAKSVELVFRVHPSLRDVEVGTYCVGGPAHSPHVLAQLRLPEGERFSLDLNLEPGRYRVTGRGLPQAWPFAVDESVSSETWDLPLRAGAAPAQPRRIAATRQQLLLTNDLGREVLVRIEREGDRDDAVTAADAASNDRFRELFPDQVLSPSCLVSVSRVTILFAQVADALDRYEEDEMRVHAELMSLAEAVRQVIAVEGGALVRVQGNGVMAVFADQTAAVRVVMSLRRGMPTAGLALHAGPAQMTTIGGRLDYFGRTLHLAEMMGQRARPTETLVGESILQDARLAALVRDGTTSLGYVTIGTTIAERFAPISPDPSRSARYVIDDAT